MTVRHDASVPVRSIELEIDVPGTPEQVWQAIATGPGFSAWFCPTTVEEREGGAVTFFMGPGLESGGVVTAWDPPRRFAVEEREWVPGAPPVATEIFVEAKAGGICRVRLVNSLFTSKADWDDQLAGFEKGWPLFLEILRLYLTHFPGVLCSPARVLSMTTMNEEHAWATLLGGLGLTGAKPGQPYTTRGLDAPEITGVVESVREHALLLRTDEPSPGVVALGASDCGPQGMLVWLGLHFYGDTAAPITAREEPKWQAWLAERFAAAAPAGAANEAAEAVR